MVVIVNALDVPRSANSTSAFVVGSRDFSVSGLRANTSWMAVCTWLCVKKAPARAPIARAEGASAKKT
jgi:hypothetical protein